MGISTSGASNANITDPVYYSHTLTLPVHLQYHTASFEADEPTVEMMLYYPFLFVQVASGMDNIARCVKRSYLGYEVPHTQHCVDLIQLIAHYYNVNYDSISDNLQFNYQAEVCVTNGSCNAKRESFKEFHPVDSCWGYAKTNRPYIIFSMPIDDANDLNKVEAITASVLVAVAITLIVFFWRTKKATK
jgi:hypothetical protein